MTFERTISMLFIVVAAVVILYCIAYYIKEFVR